MSCKFIQDGYLFESLEQFETAGLTFINNLETSDGDVIMLNTKKYFCCFLTFDGICNVIKGSIMILGLTFFLQYS